MADLRLALHGSNGHQVVGLLREMPRVQVVAVSGVPDATFDDWRAKAPDAFADARLSPSLPELIGGANADLVSLCSPRRDGQHEDTIQAMDAGLHVYAEKPLATTMAGLGAIRQAAVRTGREIRSMTGMMYDPVFRAMRRLVEDGALGDVVQVYALKSYPYHDRRPQDNGVDGGLIRQAGIHAVSYVRYVTGLEFEEVAASATRLGNPRDGDLDMAAHVTATLTGGALCTIQCNYCNPTNIGFWGNDQLRIHGTRGMAEAVDGLRRTQAAIEGKEPGPLEVGSDGTAGYGGLFADYVAHLLDGSPMLLTQADSFRNTEVVLRAQEAADRGEPICL